MTDTASSLLTLLLIVICMGYAVHRLAGIRLMKSRSLRALPKGPRYVLALLGLWAALFLAIPLTLVWGLVLAAILGICQAVALWKMRGQRHLGAGAGSGTAA
ncbi:MAG TPA: hypothetical protein VHC39_20055 [Rhizomicrobium sp.]|nr:hypothetical protein [Rhizomicrobium sp.]